MRNKSLNDNKISKKLSIEDKEKIQFILNYFNNNINLLGIVMLYYSKDNVFYNYLSKIAKTENIKIVKIEPLNLKYSIGINDPHYNYSGNRLVADRIIKELF